MGTQYAHPMTNEALSITLRRDLDMHLITSVSKFTSTAFIHSPLGAFEGSWGIDTGLRMSLRTGLAPVWKVKSMQMHLN